MMKRNIITILFACFPIISFSQCDYIEVNALSTTGEWGDEMAWEIYGPEPNSMNLIASFTGETNWSTSSETLCLEPGCYAVVMTDSWGDGWSGNTWAGFGQSFTLESGSQGYSEEFTVFSFPPSSPSPSLSSPALPA